MSVPWDPRAKMVVLALTVFQLMPWSHLSTHPPVLVPLATPVHVLLGSLVTIVKPMWTTAHPLPVKMGGHVMMWWAGPDTAAHAQKAIRVLTVRLKWTYVNQNHVRMEELAK